MGLGLVIVREIVNGHLGTITVESTADLGTVFTIQLPRDSAIE
jgi:signal transduction histidine kinase